MRLIRSIQRGNTWIRTGEGRVVKIVEELKPVGWGNNGKYEIVVYRAYDDKNTLILEIEANGGLMIVYGEK